MRNLRFSSWGLSCSKFGFSCTFSFFLGERGTPKNAKKHSKRTLRGTPSQVPKNTQKALRETSENLWNPPSQRPSQRQISLSEPLRPVAPNGVAPWTFSEFCKRWVWIRHLDFFWLYTKVETSPTPYRRLRALRAEVSRGVSERVSPKIGVSERVSTPVNGGWDRNLSCPNFGFSCPFFFFFFGGRGNLGIFWGYCLEITSREKITSNIFK